jgi:hypothetical protein
VQALLASLRGIGGERGWTILRWITADDNSRARSKYDQHARRTPEVTREGEPFSSDLERREPASVGDAQRLQECLRPLQAAKSAPVVAGSVAWEWTGPGPVRGGTTGPRLNPEEG